MNIKKARKTMAKAFDKDPDFRMGYQANIAMMIFDDDKNDLTSNKGCNALADKLIDLIFLGKR